MHAERLTDCRIVPGRSCPVLPEGKIPFLMIRIPRGEEWCGREDSNFHGLSATTTSTLRVYQFRHDRT